MAQPAAAVEPLEVPTRPSWHVELLALLALVAIAAVWLMLLL